MDEQQRIGRCIAQVRRARGMKQVDLGAAIGVSDQTISNWEVGLRTPRADYLRKMSEVLGCSADALLGLDMSANADARKRPHDMDTELSSSIERR